MKKNRKLIIWCLFAVLSVACQSTPSANEPSVSDLTKELKTGSPLAQTSAAETLLSRCCPSQVSRIVQDNIACHEVKHILETESDQHILTKVLFPWEAACYRTLQTTLNLDLLSRNLSNDDRRHIVLHLASGESSIPSIKTLLLILQDPDETVRMNAILAIQNFGETELDLVLTELEHSSQPKREYILESLVFATSHTLDLPALIPLMKRLEESPTANLIVKQYLQHQESVVDDDVRNLIDGHDDGFAARLLGLRKGFCRSDLARRELERLSRSSDSAVVYQADLAIKARKARCAL